MGSPEPKVLLHEAQGHGEKMGQGKELEGLLHEASGAVGQLEEQDQAQTQQEAVGWHEPTRQEDGQDGRGEEGKGMEAQDLQHED